MHRKRNMPFLKNCILLGFCLFFISAPNALAVGKKTSSPLSAVGMSNQQFENQVTQYVGIPYSRGGTTTDGLDCSGFVRLVYEELFGIDLPHSSVSQFKYSDLKQIERNDMQTGDLIFFSNQGKKKRINHVGVYLSDSRFIHASSSDGIKVSSLEERYWKKRFAGTRRHEDLLSGTGISQMRLESKLQIPIHEGGSIISYRRDDFRKNNLRKTSDSNDSEVRNLDNPAFESRGANNPNLHLHEIGYAHSLSDEFAINLSAIHENFDIYTAWPEYDTGSRRLFYVSDESQYGTADRYGIKLASDFKPSSWLSITPSITYFDYAKKYQDILNAPEWMFGLNTVLLPEHKQWSLSMMIHYGEKDDFKDMASPYSRFSSLDMSVKLGINLSDSVQLSITGERDTRSASYGMPGDSLMINSKDSNISMSFDFSY